LYRWNIKDLRVYLVIGALAFLAHPPSIGHAQRAPDTISMTCEAAQNYTKSQGRTNFRTGNQAFEQVVASVEQCVDPQVALIPVTAPTKDNKSCVVGYECVRQRGGR
jgi:hypothetical protein